MTPASRVAKRHMMERKSWFSDKKPQEASSDFTRRIKSLMSREVLGPLIRSGGLRDVLVDDIHVRAVAGGADLTAKLYIPESTPDPRVNLNWLPSNRSPLLLRSLKPILTRAVSKQGAILADIDITFDDFETGDAYSTYLLTVSLLHLESDFEDRAVLGSFRNR